MLRHATTFPSEVCALFNGSALGLRLAQPDGSPHVDDPVAALFRILGQLGGRSEFEGDRYNGFDATRLSQMARPEREALLVSLSTTVSRATYHYQRHLFLVERLVERRGATGFGRGHDDLTRFAVIEAASMLGAIRGAVDEMVFIGARRHGASGDDDDGWRPYPLITCRALVGDKDIEDLRVLRQYEAWFRELNDYRNALVHRGSRQTTGTGYYLAGDPFQEAGDPDFNVFLVPDRQSIGRHARPHLWTYNEKLRLEDLVRRVWEGFRSLLPEIGAVWGGVVPADGTTPVHLRPNYLVNVPRPAFFIARDDHMYAGVFTSRDRAEVFLRDFRTTDPVGSVVPVRRCLLGDGRRFYLSVPVGKRMFEGGAPQAASLKFAVDPTWDPVTRSIDYRRELGTMPLKSLTASNNFDNILLEVLDAVLIELDEVFIIEHAPG
jgi:hypothetical protein